MALKKRRKKVVLKAPKKKSSGKGSRRPKAELPGFDRKNKHEGVAPNTRRKAALVAPKKGKPDPPKVTQVIGLPGVQLSSFADGSRGLSVGAAFWALPDSDTASQMISGLRDLHRLAVGRLRHHSSWNANRGGPTDVAGTRQAEAPDGATILLVGRTGILRCDDDDQAEDALQALGDQFFEWQTSAPDGEGFDPERDDGPGSFGDGPLFDDTGQPHPEAVAKIQRVLHAAAQALSDTARTALQGWPLYNRWMIEHQPDADPGYRSAFSDLGAASELLAAATSGHASLSVSLHPSGLARICGALDRIAAVPTGRTAAIAATCERHLSAMVELMDMIDAPADDRPIAEELVTRLGAVFDDVEWATRGFLLSARERAGAEQQ